MDVLPTGVIPTDNYVNDCMKAADGEVANRSAVNPADLLPIRASLLQEKSSLNLPETLSSKTSKAAIRQSLRASTLDGVFATIFSNVAGGVLLSNFLVELQATPVEIGMLSSIPMVANFLQPLGAYLSERTTSRHMYCLWIYGPSRLLWLILVLGIALTNWQQANPELLVRWTLAIVFVTHFLGALGSASWLSWLAVLVPRRLRGRYFGIRNSAASLTSLLCVPILGFVVSIGWWNSIQGYGVVLLLAVAAGLISLGFQYFMVDVNPQVQHTVPIEAKPIEATSVETPPIETLAAEPLVLSKRPPSEWISVLKDGNFLRFLLYFSLWMFAVNLSAPFFNLYLLDNLNLDIRWVTIYNSLGSGANLLMLVAWGKIADRVGNRLLLLLVGIPVALTPILWLGTGTDPLSLWVWLPLLHILAGGTWAAIDLCSNNMQIGVAPVRHQASYFAIAAALSGVSGALGTTAGGFLSQFANYGGLLGIFALSTVLRLVALFPLVFVHERHGQPLHEVMQVLFSGKNQEEVINS